MKNAGPQIGFKNTWKIIKLRETTYIFKQNSETKVHVYEPKLWPWDWPSRWVWNSIKKIKIKIEIRVNNQFWEENKKPKATL